MKRFLSLLCLFICSATAYANGYEGTYKAVETKYSFKTLVVGPDTFQNRIRYWFVDDKGSRSIYDVAEKVKPGRYKIISNDRNYLLFKGDVVEVHHVGSTGWVDVFQKVKE